MKKLIFVCSPYSGNVEKNVEFAKQCCMAVLNEGNIPFAPHLFFTGFLDDGIPEQRKAGIDGGMLIMSKCDEVYVFGDTISTGMAIEIIEAEKLGIMVRKIPH